MDVGTIAVEDKTDDGYEVDDNIAVNLVDVIRSEMVGNEAEFLALNAAYASGLSIDPDDYLQVIVRGKSGEGKTELKQNVDKMWPSGWLLKVGSTSDMGLVDSGRWDEAYVGAFAEFQQMQGKMLEMIKSSAGDDADEEGVGFTHSRNADDGDGGRTEDLIEKQAMPTVFLFADENSAEIPHELNTRQMTIRVEADEEINRAVVKTMFDHREVTVTGREHEYNFNFEKGTQAVQRHLANIPRPLKSPWEKDTKSYARPVIIPHDDTQQWPINNRGESGAWDCAKVVEPIFNYGRTESKRGAKAVANHIRSWARMNYHSRDTMMFGGEEHVVAAPQDVANVLSYRHLLLNLTHDIDEQKLAVIDALTDEHNGVGGVGPNGGLWASKHDIAAYIDEYASIPSLSANQLYNKQTKSGGVLNQMVNNYLLIEHKGEGEDGKDMWEYVGGDTFGHPNLDLYDDLFAECMDPVTGRPIRETVEDFAEALSTTTSALDGDSAFGTDRPNAEAAEKSESDGLSAFGDGDGAQAVEWSSTDTAVCEALRDTIDDCYVEPSEIEGLDIQHMLGVTDVERYMHDTKPHVRAAEPTQEAHKADTILDPTHPLWGDKSGGQVMDIVKRSVEKLRTHDVFRIEDNDDTESKYLAVDPIE